MNADMFNSYTKEATSLTTKLQKPAPTKQTLQAEVTVRFQYLN